MDPMTKMWLSLIADIDHGSGSVCVSDHICPQQDEGPA